MFLAKKSRPNDYYAVTSSVITQFIEALLWAKDHCWLTTNAGRKRKFHRQSRNEWPCMVKRQLPNVQDSTPSIITPIVDIRPIVDRRPKTPIRQPKVKPSVVDKVLSFMEGSSIKDEGQS